MRKWDFCMQSVLSHAEYRIDCHVRQLPPSLPTSVYIWAELQVPLRMCPQVTGETKKLRGKTNICWAPSVCLVLCFTFSPLFPNLFYPPSMSDLPTVYSWRLILVVQKKFNLNELKKIFLTLFPNLRTIFFCCTFSGIKLQIFFEQLPLCEQICELFLLIAWKRPVLQTGTNGFGSQLLLPWWVRIWRN